MESRRLKDIRFQAENRLRVVQRLPGRARNGDRVSLNREEYLYVRGEWRKLTERETDDG